MPRFPEQVQYGDKYFDNYYEYRNITLPKVMYQQIPRGMILTELQCGQLGIQQSRGWVHYEIYKPEPHILLFKRAIGTDPNTSLLPQAQGLNTQNF